MWAVEKVQVGRVQGTTGAKRRSWWPKGLKRKETGSSDGAEKEKKVIQDKIIETTAIQPLEPASSSTTSSSDAVVVQDTTTTTTTTASTAVSNNKRTLEMLAYAVCLPTGMNAVYSYLAERVFMQDFIRNNVLVREMPAYLGGLGKGFSEIMGGWRHFFFS